MPGQTPADVEFGFDSFVNITRDGRGELVHGTQVIRDTVEQAVLAEEVGLDSFNVAEHYRPQLMDSAGHIILAAIATRTRRIRLGTAVTVLSTQDPVRIFQQFSTLDAVSSGRAQIILGRGSAIESFPLFGYDLAEYEELYEEKLDLFTQLLKGEPLTWTGRFRPPLDGQILEPALPAGHLPTWVGVGGSPQSVIRAARYGLPMMLAVVGGHPSRFAPHVDLYQRALEQFGHPPGDVGAHSPGYIAVTDDEAFDTYWPYYKETIETEAKIRGWHPPDREHYRAETRHGSAYVGSPDSIAPRIAETITVLGLKRFDFVYASGSMPHDMKMRTIELYGREVIPRVRQILANADVGAL